MNTHIRQLEDLQSALAEPLATLLLVLAPGAKLCRRSITGLTSENLLSKLNRLYRFTVTFYWF